MLHYEYLNDVPLLNCLQNFFLLCSHCFLLSTDCFLAADRTTRDKMADLSPSELSNLLAPADTSMPEICVTSILEECCVVVVADSISVSDVDWDIFVTILSEEVNLLDCLLI